MKPELFRATRPSETYSDPAAASPSRDLSDEADGAPEPGSESFVEIPHIGSISKLRAGMIGLKHAFRGDSSFFAHAYRAMILALTAGMLGVPPLGWILMIVAWGLVMVAELAHSAVWNLSAAIGAEEHPRIEVARNIAAAGVVVAVFCGAAISITVIVLKMGDLLGWWR